MQEQRQFISWLRHNNQHLRTYAPNEIAHLAMHCGFSLDVICGPTADHFTHLRRIIRFWESPFAGKWVALAMYEHGKGD